MSGENWLDDLIDETPTDQKKAIEVFNSELTVIDQNSYDVAAEYVRDLRALEKKIKDHFTPLKRKSQDAHKALVEAEKEQLIPVQDAIQAKKTEMSNFQRKLREAELERQKAIQLLEQEKIKRQFEAEVAGRKEEAAAISKIDTSRFVEEKIEVKADGVHTRKTWKWELTSIKHVDSAYLKVDEVAVGKLVRAQNKKAESICGGIRVWCEENVIVR